MSVTSDDPAHLFSHSPLSWGSSIEVVDVDMIDTPPESKRTSPTSDALRIDSALTLQPTPGLIPFIEVPQLSPELQREYRYMEIPDSDEEDPDDCEVVRFVGEHKVGNTVFLYALCQDNLHRRVRGQCSLRLPSLNFIIGRAKCLQGAISY
jgi:hypothetical protein